MNKGIFRLIFSKRLGMYVPASEVVRSRIGKSRSPRLRRRLAALMAAGATVHAALVFAAQPAGLIPHSSKQWSNATIDMARTSIQQMTIRQTAPKAILDWQQLNLNKGESLIFDQQGNRTWAALNRIWDNSPSVIAGKVQADGHIYFVNGNGIFFGEGAQINVGSLTATSLNVTDELFNSGILSNPLAPVFSGTGGFIKVLEGAEISAASGGRVMLLAPNVENSGVITTPDGQTIIAAGKSVYLMESTDPAGLLVEVNAGGTATNLGDIIAERGNVTVVGLAVNQQGRISATTSVRANGSIHLLARDTVRLDPQTNAPLATRGGVLTLGEGSRTRVEVDATDKAEALDGQTVAPSRVKLSGGVIDIDGAIVAHGGEIEAVAAFDPSLPETAWTASAAVTQSRILLGEHALIDVSGVDATAPMSRHQLEIQLYSDQLKDTPILRGGTLIGDKVYVDTRKGTDLFDITPLTDLKGKTIAERLSSGGTISLAAHRGDVLMNGATLDVSGGTTTYEAGYVKESNLLYNGKIVPISQANRSTPYDQIVDSYSVTDEKWGVSRSWQLKSSSFLNALAAKGTFYDAYTQGMDAGTVNIAASHMVLDATFKAKTASAFAEQRTTAPEGGTFNIIAASTQGGVIPTFRFVDTLNNVLPSDFASIGAYDEATEKFLGGTALNSKLGGETQLETRLFDNGFNQITLDATRSGSAIIVDDDISIAPDGSLSLQTVGNVAINADMSLPSGDLLVEGRNIVVADGVKISTAGHYTNDTLGVAGALTNPVAVDGGDATLSATETTTLGNGSTIDASGGAWLKADGTFKGGDGGDVTLDGITSLAADWIRSYGFGKGGVLSVSTLLNAKIGGSNPQRSDTFWLSAGFFGAGGFSGYSIATVTPDASLTVGDSSSTVINPSMQTLQARPGLSALANGAEMSTVASVVRLAAEQRTPASLSLSSKGALTVTENTVIRLDAPGSSAIDAGAIDLKSTGQMTILGDLIAPAGSISAKITGELAAFAYDKSLSLYVGENATLSAAGHYASALPDDRGLHKAEVLAGGNITLDGGERAAVVLKKGSLLDVSGTSGVNDVAVKGGYVRETRYGAAGSIGISARNGMALDGDMRAAASGTGQDGTLRLAFPGGDDVSSGKGHPNGTRVISVTEEKQLRADGMHAGDDASGFTGMAAISAKQITAGGFGSLTMEVDRGVDGDKVTMESGLNLKVGDALTINASKLEVTGSGSAAIGASYVKLNGNNSASATAGDAALDIKADFIDIAGNVAISGVKHTSLSAVQDIRGRGSKAGTADFFSGSLTTPNELVLTARQIYPVTNSRFLFEATGNDSRIEVKSSGKTPDTLLSAGGVLTLKADDIIQGGVLRAPLGQINLDAADKLILKSGSLTSVSLGGQLVPYGLTRFDGLDMLAPNENLQASESASASTMSALPEKKVNLEAADIALEEGATLDISGGGDTFAYEWISGIGGSSDILNQPGVYAVLPSLKSDYAPFDYNYQIGADQIGTALKPGEAVYLAGVEGLADGVYTLLPARYALVPGAFMVQTSSASIPQGQSVAQLDSSTLVSGYRTNVNGASRDAAYSVFRVTDGSIFHTAKGEISKAPSTYRITTGNAFFTQLASDAGTETTRLASDAGQLVLNATENLTLGAELLADKPNGARSALVDIVSSKISVVSEIGSDDGSLQLTAAALNDLGAESLLLGGTRSQGSNGMAISTGASQVTIANDDEHELELSELIAAAAERVEIKEGAKIDTGEARQTAGPQTLLASGDGALLAVSSINDLEFSRSGVSGAKGTLAIGADAVIEAGRSLVMDATKTAVLEGNVSVGDGGSATLGANRILLGSPDATIEGLHVDDALLADLGQLDRVTLNSAQNLEIHGSMALGNGDLDLTLNTSGIKGVLAAGETADFTAKTLTLKNATGVSSVAAASTGALVAHATTIVAQGSNPGSGNTTTTGIGGFETVNLAASDEVRLEGAGEIKINAANTTITSARITGGSGADYAVTASGALTTAMAANPNTLAAATGLGAKIALQGTKLNLGGKVELPSGKFAATATAGDLTLEDGASIMAASVPVAFDKYVKYTPGGTVILKSATGNLRVADNASIDVSGAGDANAGLVSLSAASGTVTLDGTLDGDGDTGAGGNFALDTGSLADFSELNEKLNDGGFTRSREIRVRNGDMTVAADDTIKAEQTIISADSGKLTVAGSIDASAGRDGLIGLYGGNGVTLTDTASLDASSSGAGNDGGIVEIAITNGYLDMQAGAVVDVSGGANGEGGEVRIRAPRTANNADIQITAVASDIRGASSVRAEGFKTYTDNSISTTDFSTTGIWYKESESFLKSVIADNGVGLSRLGKSGDSIFSIVPGLEIRNTSGDVVLANDWTLYNWRFDRDTGVGVTATANLSSGQDTEGHGLLAGVLTLRASGNLNLNGTLSDGFTSAVLTTATTAAGSGAWSYNLVGGADFSAANHREVNAAGTGNVNLASNKGVRTGAGDISIAAGGSLELGNESSVIYTAGRKADDLTGFMVPANSLYMTDGGDIDIDVKGNITGKIGTSGAQQLITHWLFRQGGIGSKQISWWVRPDLFKQGVATFGGGDVNINAGGSITNFSASAATTTRYVDTTNYVVDGGGDVNVRADGDINSGIYFAGRGEVSLDAGDAIQASANTFGTTIALMDASATVSAVGNASIETVFNPTMWAQVTANASTFDRSGSNSYFMTYGSDSAFELTSLTGDASLGLKSSGAFIQDLVSGINSTSIAKDALEIHPGTVRGTAFSGDIDLGRLVMAPSVTGDLQLLAAGDVSGSLIAMSDYDAKLLPGIANPVSQSIGLETGINQFRFITTETGNEVSHASTPVHLGDQQPVVIVADRGSVTLTGVTSSDKYAGAGLLTPKAVYVSAGKDVVFDADIQHVSSNDISVISAGRDLRLPTDPGSIIRVNGPGEVLVEAGRDVRLGDTQGIVTVADTLNAVLPDEGASITLLAGLGTDGAALADYIARYIAPTGAGPAELQGDVGKLTDYRKTTSEALATYMRKLTGDATLTEADAIRRYLALDDDRQAVFAYRHFSSELLATAEGFGESGSYDRGYQAIAALFPVDRDYEGDLTMFKSQIHTLRGGSIDVLTPGGLINVGVPTSSGSDIGIVTEKGGDIHAFAKLGFQVEQSKVKAPNGGNIIVWSDYGDIDAGRGSKSAVSIPERIVSTDADGNTTVDMNNPAVGSGIQAPFGNVALIAPRGKINANEAGVVAGGFLGLATEIVGADNIQVSGSSNIPVTDSGALAGALAGVSNVASEATKSASDEVARQVAQSATPQAFESKQLLPALVSVEVIGLGD